mgnify:CR=1 FL=1
MCRSNSRMRPCLYFYHGIIWLYIISSITWECLEVSMRNFYHTSVMYGKKALVFGVFSDERLIGYNQMFIHFCSLEWFWSISWQTRVAELNFGLAALDKHLIMLIGVVWPLFVLVQKKKLLTQHFRFSPVSLYWYILDRNGGHFRTRHTRQKC